MTTSVRRHRPGGRLPLAVLLGLGLAVPMAARAQDDPIAAGEKVFKRCGACHQIGDGAKNQVGPELNGVIGRTAGTLDGYTYSDAMVAAGKGGLVWSAETLDPYLKSPKDLVPGTKMTFAGLKKDDERAAVIAYLVKMSGS